MSITVSTGSPRLALLCERIAVLSCGIAVLQIISLLFLPALHASVPMVIGNMLFLLCLCILHAIATKGWRKALGFTALSFVISWFVEFIGCNYSLWFGDYEYTDVLGAGIGNVPLIVVVAWEVVIYPSLLLVDELLSTPSGSSTQGRWLVRITLASLATALVTTAWDMMTDPNAVHEGFWRWDHGGSYMPDIGGGMPYGNFWGWIAAVFIISFLYRLLFTSRDTEPSNSSNLLFAVSLYTSLCLGAMYGLYANGLYQPMFIGVFTMGPVAALGWAKWARL